MKTVRADPTVAILLLAGFVHALREAPLDTSVFVGTAALIMIDRVHRLIPSTTFPERLAATHTGSVVAAAVPYGAVIGLFPAASLAVKLWMAVPGIVVTVAVLAVRPDAPQAPPAGAGSRDAPRVLPWAGLFVAAALWELTSFVSQPSPTVDNERHPTLSAIIDPQIQGSWRRGLIAAAWLVVGHRLVRIIVAEGATHQASQPQPAHGRAHLGLD